MSGRRQEGSGVGLAKSIAAPLEDSPRTQLRFRTGRDLTECCDVHRLLGIAEPSPHQPPTIDARDVHDET